jgi:Flp pilus assembly protein TadD
MCRSLQFLLLTACFPPACAPEPRDLFSISGVVLQTDGTVFGHPRPVVILNSTIEALSKETIAGTDGSFQFSGLNKGMYTIVAAVPGAPVVRRTVDVGRAHADGRHAVTVELRLDAVPGGGREVSVNELRVPHRAREEHLKSRNRLGRKDVKGAVACLRKALALAPHFSAAWNDLGAIAFHEKDYPQAEACFREALRGEPQPYSALVNLGNVLLSERKTDESLAVNERAVSLNPTDPMAQAQLGVSYFYAGNDEMALLHLKKAKDLDPSHFSYPQLGLVRVYERRGDFAAAEGEMKEFLRLHPDSRIAPQVRAHLEKHRASVKP